jgi:hypothetical protein
MASQNANAVAITGGAIDGTTIGGTTPAAATFTTLTSNATTNLSSTVNIRNGGTVTAITRITAGTNYTGVPSLVISAPTTAGGVQATATAQMSISGGAFSVASGGTGYTVGNLLSVVGGTTAQIAQFTVAAVDGSGAITSVTLTTSGSYSVLPSSPVSLSGGTGTSATLNVTAWNLSSSPALITNAGSGYVEQPIVTFSSGGGSGAAAYASVGAGTIIRSLGSTGTQSLDFYTPATATNVAPAFRIRDNISDSYPTITNGLGVTSFIASGSANAILNLISNGTGQLSLRTNGTSSVEGMRVAHTASAVNYVQVTGSATGPGGSALGGISFTGSDTNVNGAITTKGTGYIAFAGGASTANQAFRVNTTGAAASGNLVVAQGSAAGGSPSIQVVSGTSGTDANIDLTLTPKGTGNVRFGTYTATADVPITGYIEIKDAGGTVRRLAVIA